MKFAAFGRTQLLYDSIQAAIEERHELVLLGTCKAAPEYTVTEDDFSKLATKLNCNYFCSSSINRPEYIKLTETSGAEVAISINWLTIIGREMLNQFKYGIINAHAGNLPRYRGNACPNWAILAGENKVVFTLHQMETELDAGAILLQKEFLLTPNTYIADIYRFAAQNIPKMFVEVLNGLTHKTILPQEQSKNPALSLRCFPRTPQDGEIDWNRPAEELARLIRASSEPFAGAYSFINTEKIIVWKAHSEELSYPYLGVPGQVVEIRKNVGEISVLTQKGILVIEEIETASSGREQPSKIIKSTRTRLGMNHTQEILRLTEKITHLEYLIQQQKNKLD